MKIEELHFSLRTYNCLKRSGIDTVEQLRKMTDEELMKIRGFGIGCLMEVRMAEPYFRNGETHMKEKVIGMLMDHKVCTDGVCHRHIAEIVRNIEQL